MINEGEYVIFKKADFMKIFQVKKTKPIIIDKFKCKFDNLIGKPFGFKYEIKEQQLQLLKKSESNDENGRKEIVRDNRNIVDNTENQKLSREDIEKLKVDDELTGTEIIDRLIENSSSFSQKTEYSQAKYIKKKEEKYLAVYEILRPTIRTLCQYYTQGNNKRKILNIRMDTMAQMLTYSNLAAHRNVMILESCKGLLLAAVVERLAGNGKIINLSPNGSHISTRETLDYMNFPPEYLKNLYQYPLERLDKVQEYMDELNRKISVAKDNEAYVLKQTQKLEVAKLVNELLLNKEIDCLIVACKFKPLPILERALKFMGPNRYLVVYSNIQEPLIECHTHLKRSHTATHIELSDSFLREYQVLPERTHPKVMMDACSGFLLTGITVSNDI